MSTPENPILTSLNKAQRRAVTSAASTVAILAGPGSGKTHTLTSRVVWLIQELGYRPADIIVATFTVKAAREMKERIGKTLGTESEGRIVLGTFHSIARRYLSVYGKKIGLDSNFGIADDGDSKAIIKRICKRLDLNVEPSYAKSWISKKKAKGQQTVSRKTGKQVPDSPALLECMREYQEHLARSNLLDYDDLLVKCVELLQEHPSCVSNVQSVLIDEYQDTNGIQYELMKLFAQARQRITIVGDPDQSIYGWRSAEIRNLYRLLRDYPETDEISLEENYRSSQSILNVSLNVIQQDKNRYKKVLLPIHNKGARPVLRKLKSAAAEGEWIVGEIRRAVMMSGDMLKYEDAAILLRSASLSRHIEAALGKSGIAYRMIGGHKFYERKEIKVLLDYLRVVYQPETNDAVARIVNVPRRGIGEATVKSLLEEAEQAKTSVWSLLWRHCRGGRSATTNITKKMEQKLNTELLRIISNLRQKTQEMTECSPFTLVDLIESLVNQLNFQKYLEDEYKDDHEHRWANVQEFVGLANDFMRDVGKIDEDELPEIQGIEQVKRDDVLGRFLANIALASDAQKGSQDQDTSSVVTISTIHAAKGLEWPVVFVPSVYTGSIPHSRSEDEDEERRLLYVAMTRAKALLYLSCPLYGSQGMGNKVELSPFVSSFAKTAFERKGPTFNQAVLTDAANILGREAPSDQTILRKLPAMFQLEDDLFPIEPFDSKNDGGDDENSRQAKRQRMRYYDGDGGEEEEEAPWEKGYQTTMETSSNCTVPSMPGFVTAGAHQNAMSVAEAEAAKTAEREARAKQAKRGSTRRGADQKSMLGFVTRTSTGAERASSIEPEAAKKHPASFQRHDTAPVRQTSRPLSDLPLPRANIPKPAVEPSLMARKLTKGPSFSKPSFKPSENDDDGPRGHYACFSSSPTRPTSADDDAKEKEKENVRDQPASTFHTTTFMAAGGRGGMGGVRRTIGLGPKPGMTRLSKPFKPLTISRPQGPK